MPTLEEFLTYLGYDVTDDEVVNKNATRCLATAHMVLHGAVGEDVETFLPGDSRVTELVLVYAEDLFSQRGMAAKVTGATRRMVFDMEQQLKLELRRAKEEQA